MKFYLNVRKKLTIVRAVKHWNRLSWEVGESPFSELFKTWLDIVLEQPVLDDPSLSRGLDYMIFRTLFHCQLFCESESCIDPYIAVLSCVLIALKLQV